VLSLVGRPLHLLGPGIASIWSIAVQAVLAPYSCCVLVLLYLDLVARKGGDGVAVGGLMPLS
jgi:hypothetical protein